MSTNLQGTVTGILNRIDLPKSKGKWTSKTFTIEVPGDYPQYIQLELKEKDMNKIDPFKVGDSVSADYFLNGNNWTSPDGRIITFNTLKCFNIKGEENKTEEKAEAHFSDSDLPF
jgi:hypothetical protein|tara:strand:- start:15584 stop:15928 length:345 start_codon:yes stop_codon:yes gene_type:complete